MIGHGTGEIIVESMCGSDFFHVCTGDTERVVEYFFDIFLHVISIFLTNVYQYLLTLSFHSGLQSFGKLLASNKII